MTLFAFGAKCGGLRTPSGRAAASMRVSTANSAVVAQQAAQGHGRRCRSRACRKKCRRVRLRATSVLHASHSLVIVSSRFSTTLATIVQAARSASGRSSSPAGLPAAEPAPPRMAFAASGSCRSRSSCSVVEGQERPRAPAALGRRASAEPERVVGARFRGRGPPRAHDARGQRPRGLEEGRVVEGGERLQRRVGAHAPHGAELAAGRVEGGEHRVGRRAPHEGVEAAAVAVLALRSSSTCRRCRGCPRCPSGWSGKTLGPADLRAQQAAGRERRRRAPSRPPCGSAARARAGGCRDRARCSAGRDARTTADRSPRSRSAGGWPSWLHPARTNSVASQSSSSGCVGGSPCVPKSSLVSTMPRPKNCSQTRLTVTRAVSGLSSLDAASARGRGGSAGASSGSGGSDGGRRRHRPARPGTCSCPRMRSGVEGRSKPGCSRITIAVGLARSARCFSRAREASRGPVRARGRSTGSSRRSASCRPRRGWRRRAPRIAWISSGSAMPPNGWGLAVTERRKRPQRALLHSALVLERHHQHSGSRHRLAGPEDRDVRFRRFGVRRPSPSPGRRRAPARAGKPDRMKSASPRASGDRLGGAPPAGGPSARRGSGRSCRRRSARPGRPAGSARASRRKAVMPARLVRASSVYVSLSGFSPAASTEPSGATVRVVPLPPAARNRPEHRPGRRLGEPHLAPRRPGPPPGPECSLRGAPSVGRSRHRWHPRLAACSGVGSSSSGSTIHLSTTVVAHALDAVVRVVEEGEHAVVVASARTGRTCGCGTGRSPACCPARRRRWC